MLGSRTNYVVEVVRVSVLLMVLPLAVVVLIPGSWLREQAWLRFARLIDSPLVAPVLTPVVLGLFFFTAIWGAVLTHGGLYALSYPVLLVIGLLLHVGLVGIQRQHSSTTWALLFLVSLIELLLDAIPGIAMMLSGQVLNAAYWLSVTPGATTEDLLGQQRLAGGLMLLIAELMDLPVLFVVVARWVRADARETREIDAYLDAQEG